MVKYEEIGGKRRCVDDRSLVGGKSIVGWRGSLLSSRVAVWQVTSAVYC